LTGAKLAKTHIDLKQTFNVIEMYAESHPHITNS